MCYLNYKDTVYNQTSKLTSHYTGFYITQEPSRDMVGELCSDE